MFRLMPGNPLAAYIDPTFTEEQAEAISRPVWARSSRCLFSTACISRISSTGNFGTSFFQKKPVFDILMDVFPNTILLTGTALARRLYVFGVLVGALLAWRRGSRIESAGILAP